MDGIISNATTSFETATGVSMDGAFAWVVTNILKPWLGSAFGLLYTLRFWIVGLIIFGIIMYFGYRVLKLNRH